MEKRESLADFIKYNNAVPIVLGILFLGTSATLAASPAAREAVYAADTVVQSIDNSYIVSVDLEKHSFRMRVTGVTEDDDYYYVAYDFDTIDIVDGVWQDVVKQNVLRVSKVLLGSQDLETYAESELAQVRATELRRLTETQAYEKRLGVSQKVVATVRSGLIGKFIKPTEEVVPQYVSEASEDDPLAVEDPVPLVTWDANAEPEEVEVEEEEPTPPPATDVCQDVPGLQSDPEDCLEAPPATPPVEELPAEEPPVEEPPVTEEPVAEEPVTEEPAPEEPVAEEPAPKPKPVPEPTEEGESGGVE